MYLDLILEITDRAIPFESLLQLASCSGDSNGIARSVFHVNLMKKQGKHVLKLTDQAIVSLHVKMSFKIPFLMNVIDVFPHTKYKT